MRSLFRIFKSFSKNERIIFSVALAASIILGVFLLINIFNHITVKKPAYGGEYTEGVIGQPSFINPVLAEDGSPGKDISTLLFADVRDFAESIRHNKNYTSWDLRIKGNAVWTDGSPITTDDIIFTINTIQNPNILSPLFQSWKNVKITRVSSREVKFKLNGPYSLFYDNVLSALRPIPKKLFNDLSPASFRLSIYNLEPVGSGLYKYKSLTKRRDGFKESYALESNSLYSKIGKTPYIKTIKIKFYSNAKKLVDSYNHGEIDGFYASSYSTVDNLIPHSYIYTIPTTKYVAVFFNKSANKSLANPKVRMALALSINRGEIIKEAYRGGAMSDFGPIPPTFSMYNKKLSDIFEYSTDKAKQDLKDAGWTYNDKIKRWTKSSNGNTETLNIELTVPDIKNLKETANIVANDWKEIGVGASVNVVDTQLIKKQNIETRNYQALVFGSILSNFPDLYSFWNSSERFYPGLNLSLYNNSDVDDLLVKIRAQDPSSSERLSNMEKIQSMIIKDVPAIFLVSPVNYYVVRNNIPGILVNRISLPSERFSKIGDWYVKTKRTFVKK